MPEALATLPMTHGAAMDGLAHSRARVLNADGKKNHDEMMTFGGMTNHEEIVIDDLVLGGKKSHGEVVTAIGADGRRNRGEMATGERTDGKVTGESTDWRATGERTDLGATGERTGLGATGERTDEKATYEATAVERATWKCPDARV